jgi:hypothetical protein
LAYIEFHPDIKIKIDFQDIDGFAHLPSVLDRFQIRFKKLIQLHYSKSSPLLENLAADLTKELILDIYCKHRLQIPFLGMKESYHLEVMQRRITLRAENEVGIMHGLETILQLIKKVNISGEGKYLYNKTPN